MMRTTFVIISILMVTAACSAVEKTETSETKSSEVKSQNLKGIGLIKETIRKYNATNALKMRVLKEVKLSLLEQTKESRGLLYFSKGLMRLEIEKPEETTIVLNSEAVWVETKVDGFEGLTTHVTKIASKGLKERAKAPLVMLLTETKAWDDFEITKAAEHNKSKTLFLKPKEKGAYPELSKVKININTETNELWFISYQDEIENEVTYKFQRPDFDVEVSESKFKYQPPDGAEVVTY